MERELARTERRVRRVVAWVAERSRQQEARRDEAAGQRMVCARLRDELAMMREYRRLRTQVSAVQYSTAQYSTVPAAAHPGAGPQAAGSRGREAEAAAGEAAGRAGQAGGGAGPGEL